MNDIALILHLYDGFTLIWLCVSTYRNLDRHTLRRIRIEFMDPGINYHLY